MGERGFVVQSCVFYGLMGLIALAWGSAYGDVSRWLGPPALESTLIDAALGASLGLVIVALSHLLERWSTAMQALSTELSSLIPPLSRTSITLVAVLSALGEELLFRGAMQDAWGFWPTVALFAVVHGLFIRRLWLWMVFAAVTGLGLGAVAAWSQGLLGVVLAHFTINYFNLGHMSRPRPEVLAAI